MTWPMKSLGEVCDITVGRTPARNNPEFWGPGEPWVSIADMNQGLVITDTKEQITTAAAKSGRPVSKGTVLLSFKLSIGKVGIAGQDLFTNEAIAALPINNSDELRPDYLVRALQVADLAAGANRAAMGATLNKAKLQQVQIPVPPLDEQRRLAEILDQADGLRARRRTVDQLLAAMERSVYWSMYGAGEWEEIALIDLCVSQDDVRCGPFGTQLQKAEVTTKGVPLWGIKNVNVGFSLEPFEFVSTATAKRLNQYSIIPGDIVMTRKGTVGNCAVYPDQWEHGVMHSDLLRVRLDHARARTAFISHQLHHDPRVASQMTSMSSGAVMPGINVGRLKGLKVISPPLESQDRFEKRLHSLSAIRRLAGDTSSALDTLFASLQSRAFAGQL